MRFFLLATLLALPCAAQEGVWTGYVRGFVRTGPTRAVPVVWQPSIAVVQQWLVMQRSEQAAQEEAQARQRRLDEEAALLREQAELARQALATQEAIALQQRQAIEFEQQRLAQQEREFEAQQRLAAAPTPTPPQPPSTMPEEPRRLESGPKKKGPPIHSWVDEDGVTHYSTKTRAETEKPKRK